MLPSTHARRYQSLGESLGWMKYNVTSCSVIFCSVQFVLELELQAKEVKTSNGRLPREFDISIIFVHKLRPNMYGFREDVFMIPTL